jgi:asparagine synthase (glutamine-hydrolysing)
MDAVQQHERSLRWTRLQVLQAIDLKQRLPNCLLIKLDRATMANGVEGRTPFLDRRVAKFALQVPDALKANPRIGKQLMREWVHTKFPEAQPYAKKRGFDLPLGSWMAARRSVLSELVCKHPATQSVIPSALVEQVFAACAEAPQPAWNLLSYALWYSHHVLQIDAEGNIEEVLDAAGRNIRPRDNNLADGRSNMGGLSGYAALGNRGPIPTMHVSGA